MPLGDGLLEYLVAGVEVRALADREVDVDVESGVERLEVIEAPLDDLAPEGHLGSVPLLEPAEALLRRGGILLVGGTQASRGGDAREVPLDQRTVGLGQAVQIGTGRHRPLRGAANRVDRQGPLIVRHARRKERPETAVSLQHEAEPAEVVDVVHPVDQRAARLVEIGQHVADDRGAQVPGMKGLGHIRRRVVDDIGAVGAGVVEAEPVGELDHRGDAGPEPFVGQPYVDVDALLGHLAHDVSECRRPQRLDDERSLGGDVVSRAKLSQQSGYPQGDVRTETGPLENVQLPGQVGPAELVLEHAADPLPEQRHRVGVSGRRRQNRTMRADGVAEVHDLLATDLVIRGKFVHRPQSHDCVS